MELSGENKRLSCMKNTEKKNLPHELVIEILSWLPIKHLCPLRFVSKSWHQLLTKDPQFAKLQFDRFMQSNPTPSIIASKHENDSTLFLATEFESCDKALALPFPFHKPNNEYILFGNCNGLLSYHRDDHKKVHVWNPIINDHITVSCLPAPSIRFPGYRNCTGFGFDQESNVYKMVRFFNEYKRADSSIIDTQTQISVYTIGVDSMWRTVQVDVPSRLPATGWLIPLVNGVLHWKTRRVDTRSYGYDLIFTFDMKREVIGELTPPCVIKIDVIVELGGFLCVVDPSAASEIHIWIMKEYGLVSSWSKQYIIAKPRPWLYSLVPLGFTHDEQILMGEDNWTLALYCPETNTVSNLDGFQGEWFLPYAYIGSIISPTVICRAGHNLLEEES